MCLAEWAVELIIVFFFTAAKLKESFTTIASNLVKHKQGG